MPRFRFLLYFVFMLGMSVACNAFSTQSTPSTPTQTPTVDARAYSATRYIVESSFSDANTLNPILATDSASFAVINQLFLSLLTVDAFSGELVGEIATSWDSSADGLAYTFQLRDDIVWSDGTPLTAQDVKFTYDAIRSDAVDSPRKSAVELIEAITIQDRFTVTFTFSQVDCTALTNLTLGILPAHVYADDFSDLMDHAEAHAPQVTSGAFLFDEWLQDDHITLLSNPDYVLGAPPVAGWTFRVFVDQASELAAILANETHVASVGAQYVTTIDDKIAADDSYRMTKYYDDGYTFIGFNLANPANPQLGFDDLNGNGAFDAGEPPLEQEPHPVLGDLAVREAIAMSLDYDNIIERAVFGEAQQATANVLPAIDWAFNDELEPIAYDLELATTTLESAGWLLNEDDGVRYKDGQALRFTLMTNAGNEIRANIALITQDTLKQIGVDVEVDIIEFGTMVEQMLGQTYDAVVIGWTGLGSDPEDSSQFAYRNDVPGAGFNFVSYHNEIVEENLTAARSLAGCNSAKRGVFYRENQAEIQADLPYAFLYVPLANVVSSTSLEEVEPGAWSTYYNVQEWVFVP